MANSKKVLVGVALLLSLGVLGYVYRGVLIKLAFRPTSSVLQQNPVATNTVNLSEEASDITIVAENIFVPWEIAFLPDGTLLVTQRSGELLHIGKDRSSTPIAGVEHVGEGGLLGMALHPNFAENNWMYLYLTTHSGKGLENRVERYVLKDGNLSDKRIILEAIPGAQYHDGGRIAFGPDGYLYITTGDAQNEALAQDTSTLNGSILRVADDGSLPSDNPFGSAVYSYGHRNVQGIAWDNENRLWATEHGRSGLKSGYDELNLIKAGGNYGWPNIEGDEVQEGMTAPVIHSGPDETWAPSGMVYFRDSLYFVGLRGSALYRARLDGEKVGELVLYLRETFGRLRTVQIGPDGFVYIATSNTDGRGTPDENDDKILKVNPRVFE
jgi:glucose/arabinose dehydrogenase